jgi:hypothetical protein
MLTNTGMRPARAQTRAAEEGSLRRRGSPMTASVSTLQEKCHFVFTVVPERGGIVNVG